MRFLVDTQADKVRKAMANYPFLVGGQLMTPLTQYGWWSGEFAIDNGAFSQFLDKRFVRMLDRMAENKADCLFVACPDIVGSARRTMELWKRRRNWIKEKSGWPVALVAQDGLEDMEVPWDDLHTLFIGGRDPWKDSQAVLDLVKTAKTLGKRVHVGRVNTLKRYQHFAKAGADTCDGSGIAKYDHMLAAIYRGIKREDHPQLFECKNGIEVVV